MVRFIEKKKGSIQWPVISDTKKKVVNVLYQYL